MHVSISADLHSLGIWYSWGMRSYKTYATPGSKEAKRRRALAARELCERYGTTDYLEAERQWLADFTAEVKAKTNHPTERK